MVPAAVMQGMVAGAIYITIMASARAGVYWPLGVAVGAAIVLLAVEARLQALARQRLSGTI